MVVKGRGHNYWWLRRGDGGRFRKLNPIDPRELIDQTAAYYAYAERLAMELNQKLETKPETHETLKAFIREHLDDKPIEYYGHLRSFCIEQGWVNVCPDCDGNLHIMESQRCKVCGGTGYLNG